MADVPVSGKIFPADSTIVAKVKRVLTFFQNAPNEVLTGAELQAFNVTAAPKQDDVLTLAKDIAVPVRQNIKLNFYPFAQWSSDAQPQYDDEGRVYRYREGRPSYRREPDDVKDAPDSDWPVRKQSRRRRNRLAILDFTQGRMGCHDGLLRGMDHVEQVVKKYMGVGRYRRLDIDGAPHVASTSVNPVEFLSQFDGLKIIGATLDGLADRTP